MSTIEQKLSSRDALLKAATELFSSRGYDAVSTRELAESAGVNLAAIKYHFGSKANLFVEAVKSMMCGSGCEHSKVLQEISAETPSAAAKILCQFIESFMGYLLKPVGPQACRIMFREIFPEVPPTQNTMRRLSPL